MLAGHLHGSLSSSTSSGQYEYGLERQQTAATAVRSLPKFDPYILETYLDDLREMKRQVYDLFKFKPELLPGPELSKGPSAHASVASRDACSSNLHAKSTLSMSECVCSLNIARHKGQSLRICHDVCFE